MPCQPRLNIWQIEEVYGNDDFVVASRGDVIARCIATGVACTKGEARLFRIQQGTDGLKNEALRGLLALLEFSPFGLVEWRKSGW